MSRLAIELGISDVGPAKACRRNAIPAPPRGYWAKLKAGQKPEQTPLPTPESDIVLLFETSEPKGQRNECVKGDETERDEGIKVTMQQMGAPSDVTFVTSLDDAHTLTPKPGAKWRDACIFSHS